MVQSVPDAQRMLKPVEISKRQTWNKQPRQCDFKAVSPLGTHLQAHLPLGQPPLGKRLKNYILDKSKYKWLCHIFLLVKSKAVKTRKTETQSHKELDRKGKGAKIEHVRPWETTAPSVNPQWDSWWTFCPEDQQAGRASWDPKTSKETLWEMESGLSSDKWVAEV